MPAAEVHLPETELERIERWRAEELERAGYGPRTVHMYGLMLLLAIAAAIGLTGIRWVRAGGDWDLVVRTAVWGVAFGIVGARAYHDLTSWSEVPKEWWGAF